MGNEHEYREADPSPAAGAISSAIGAWPCRECGAAESAPVHVSPVVTKMMDGCDRVVTLSRSLHNDYIAARIQTEIAIIREGLVEQRDARDKTRRDAKVVRLYIQTGLGVSPPVDRKDAVRRLRAIERRK